MVGAVDLVRGSRRSPLTVETDTDNVSAEELDGRASLSEEMKKEGIIEDRNGSGVERDV